LSARRQSGSHDGRRRHRARGAVIVVAGPDGSGKTLVAEHLVSVAQERGPVLHLHHRPHVLHAASQHDGPVTEPHRQKAYPGPLAVLKLFYLFLDYALGWALRLGPTRRAGGIVILERGWWDMIVDPLRYRLVPLPRLHRLLARLLPKPDHIIVLDAPSEVLLARKAELPTQELERQRAAWRELATAVPNLTLWDATRPAEEVAPFALGPEPAAVAERHWVGLPPTRSPRWVLPTDNRRVTRAGLRIHRPVSGRALAGWSMGSALASSGMLRRLPRVVPEPWILDRVAGLIPAGGTIATTRSNHANRSVALILDPTGVAVWIAKVSCDPASDAQLAAEAAALQRYGALLPAPVRAPRLDRVETGLLLFEPIHWRHQPTPWRLEPAVAEALGHLYHVEQHANGTGIGHGDVAPWNLLRTRREWYLVDWEAAGPGYLPYHDIFHHLVQSHSLLGRPRAGSIFDGLRGRGWVGRSLRAYAAAAGLELEPARHHLVAYLERSMPAADVTKRDARRERAARRALLEGLGAAKG